MFKNLRYSSNINLKRLLALNSNTTPRKVETLEEYDELQKDSKYIERRMYSLMTEVIQEIDLTKDKPKKKKQPKKYPSLHYLVSKTKVFNSDKILTRNRNNELIMANNRLTIKVNELEESFNDISKMIVICAITSKYGVFIDGLGHLFVNPKKMRLEMNFFNLKKMALGNLFKNIKFRNSKILINLISTAKDMGQEWAEDSSIISRAFDKYYRKVVINTPYTEINYNIEEMRRQSVLLKMLKKK